MDDRGVVEREALGSASSEGACMERLGRGSGSAAAGAATGGTGADAALETGGGARGGSGAASCATGGAVSELTVAGAAAGGAANAYAEGRMTALGAVIIGGGARPFVAPFAAQFAAIELAPSACVSEGALTRGVGGRVKGVAAPAWRSCGVGPAADASCLDGQS
eukprot:6194909-Pleurochrysis_carterae.AAC.3